MQAGHFDDDGDQERATERVVLNAKREVWL